MRTLHGASKETRIAARYVPVNSRRVLVKADGVSCVYLYELGGKYLAIAYRGTSSKREFHVSYRTAEARRQAVEQFFASVTASQTRKADARAKKAAWVNPLTVGTILYTSWGYDQTNVEFYAVTRVSGKRVWVREIAKDYAETGFLSGTARPAQPIRVVGEETMHTAQPCDERGAAIHFSSYRRAHVYDGQALYESHYA